MNRLRVFIIALGVFALLLVLACGPAADVPANPVPDDAGALAQEEPTAEPTPTPFPTKEPPPPAPTKLPINTPVPDLPPTPVPVHPEGLEGCKSAGMFQSDIDAIAYSDRCSEQLSNAVRDQCRSLPTEAEQLACGNEIAGEYNSVFFRYGPDRCGGTRPGSDARATCVEQAMGDFFKSFEDMWEAWRKIRIGGDTDPAVTGAMKDTVTCLEGKGFEKVNTDLLFGWQKVGSPAESKAREGRLSPEEKELRDTIREPSRDCAKEHGLFEAQDKAWTTELRRLDKDEPELVADLIREGLLETLEKPGVAMILTGDIPQSLRNMR